jgi:nicotinamidase-related amidase
MSSEDSRRDFMMKALTAGSALAMTGVPVPRFAGVPFPGADIPGRSAFLRIKPRYYRWFVAPGFDWAEMNTDYAMLDWEIPVSQAALVLVDVWNGHYLRDTNAREEAVVSNVMVPLLAACRQAGLPVIHAPSPGEAIKEPNWVRLISESELHEEPAAWPPTAFRAKSGPYEGYRRPDEARQHELDEIVAHRTLHPKVRPGENEGVVATGEELHRYCRRRGILFLLFAGFNTNACILVRDYGTLAMSDRGYEVVLVRDATTGMESRETHSTLAQTRGATLFLEMFGRYSVASSEVIAGLAQA